MDLDELERLRAVAEQQLGSRELGSTYLYETDVDAYMTALRNSVEELIRDARRYQFMLRNIHSLIAVMDEWENTVTLEWGRNYEHKLTAPIIPQAIDAAIAQEGKG